ncbi:MAG: SusC/RagA family TonB-linked outer membrane protein, partial [Prevotellaceae bacterium]|nr:SusC/RagA family TonB-linked outer membrane protein [Prevotellaceae bacterium]
SISVPATATTLVFSEVGHTEIQVDINGRTIINVAMEPGAEALDEVIVIGYGSAKKVGTVVGSVARVSAQKIENRPSPNLIDALQGQVAGLQTFTSTGEPGQFASSFRLHGVGSLDGDNTPLMVLDGIPIASMSAINPNDIANISILKDASATSIYGSRASNGVVYITTKRGNTNKDATITVGGMMGWSSLASRTFWNDFMTADEYGAYLIDTDPGMEAWVNAQREQYPYNTNWGKYLFKDNAPTYKADISIQGGGGKTTYYVSGSYLDQEGITFRSGYKRYTVRANIDSRANDWLKFGVNLSGGYSETQTSRTVTGGAYTNGGLIFLQRPWYTPWDENGNEKIYIDGPGFYSLGYTSDVMPSVSNRILFSGLAYVELTPFKGFTIRSQGGIDGYDYRQTAKTLPTYLGSLGNGSTAETFDRDVTRVITNTIEYKFNIKEAHSVTLLAGQEGIDYSDANFRASSSGQSDIRLTELQHGPNNKNAGQMTDYRPKSEYAYLSFFGRVDYSFNEKYFADFSIRNDQSSRFGKNNRSAMFYAGGLMWNAKKEQFLENISWLNSLKVHASVGTSGNSSIGNYTTLALIGTNTYDGKGGWGISSPGNSSLTWEKQTLINFRADADFYNRYHLAVEYYIRNTSSMLLDTPYPYTSGFGEVTSNVGSLKNTGIDITLGVDFIRTKDAWATFTTTFNYNKTKITELFLGLDRWTVPNTGVTYVIGHPVESYWPLYAGIDPADGMPMWYVPGDDIAKTTKNETTKIYDENALMQNSGKSQFAPFSGGFGLGGGWKGFQIQADFAYVIGKYLYNNDRYFSENPWNFYGYNQSKKVRNYWKKPGDIADFPVDTEIMQFDDRLLENASFLRLKTLTIAYNLPEIVLKNVKFIKNFKVYFTGRNLFTVTKYSGSDPEPDINLTYGRYPNTKQYSVGVEVTF